MATPAVLELLFKADTKGFDAGAEGIKGKLGGLGKLAAGAGLAMGAGLAAGAVAAGKEWFDAAGQANQAVNNLQAQLGLTAETAEHFGGIGREVFASNWGADIGEATAAVGQLAQAFQFDVPPDQLKAATDAAFALRDVMGVELETSTRLAANMFSTFGSQGAEAFDTLTRAMQNAGPASEDMADSFLEYSDHFARLGFEAEQMGAMLANAVQNGAWNTDVAGDAIKEFGIRISDGTLLTKEALEALPASVTSVARAFESGGATGEEAFHQILSAIGEIEDPIARYQAGVAAFGTKWEDVGEEAMMAMGRVGDGLTNVEGAALKAGDAMNANIGSAFETMKRTALTALMDIGGGEAFQGLEQGIIGVINNISANIGPAIEGIASALEPAADAVGRFMEGFQNGADDGMMPFTSALSGLAEMLDGLIPEPVVQAIRDFSGAFEQAAEVLSGSKDAVSSYNPVVQALGDIFVTVGQTIAAWVDGAKAVFLDVQGAVTILADAFRQHFDTISAKVGEVWAWIESNVVPVVEQVVSDVVDKIAELRDQFDEHFGGIQGMVKSVVDWFNANVAPTLGAVFGFVGDQLKQLWALIEFIMPALQLAFSGAFDTIVAVVQTAFGILKGIVEAGLALMRGDFQGVAEGIRDAMAALVRGIIPIFVGLFKTVVGIIGAAIPVAVAAIVKVGEAIIKGLANAIAAGASIITGALVGLAKGAIQAAKDVFGIKSPSTVFADIGANVVEGFRLGLLGMEEVAQWVNDVLGKTIGAKDVNSLEQVARATEAIRDTTAAVIDTLDLLMTANMPEPDKLAQKFRDLIGGFEGVIEKMRQISLFADKDKLPEFGYQLSKWDVANVNAVSGALKSIADLIKGLADAVKATTELDQIDASVFDKVKVAAMAAGSIAVELAASFGSSFGTEAASKSASAVASSIEAFAGVLKTVADLKLGDIAELAADGLDVVKVNAGRLKDALFESTADFQAASDAALDHGVKAVTAFASYVKAAADAFQTAGGFKLGEATRITAADMVLFKDNARVLIDALWEASKGFVEASESDITKTERGVGAFVAMIQAAADAMSAGKAAADGLKEATVITAASITTHLVHLRDVVIPAVEGVVNGWDHTNAEAARMTERVEAFAALMSAAVGAHDAIPRGELEAAIDIDKSALVRYLTRMRELIIPAVVEVVAQWDMANDKAAEWAERIDVFARLMSAVVGANEAIPHERSLIGMNINVANLTKHLTLFRDKYIPALDAVLQGWRMAEDVSKELLTRAGSFLALMKAVTDAEGAIPKLAEKQAGYAEISADAFKAALLHVRDHLIPALDFVLQGFTYSEKVAGDLLSRATAFGGMLDAIVSAYNAITTISAEAPRALSQGAIDGFKAAALLLFTTMADVMREGGITAEIAAARQAAAEAAGSIADGMASVLDVVALALENPFGRIRAGGQRGDTLRANLKERVRASLVAAVEAIQEAAAGLSFTLPEGLADKMAQLADAFRPILEIIEGLRGGIDLRALRQLALAPGILAAGLTFASGEINGTVTGDSVNLDGLTINLDVQPTLMPLALTHNTTNNIVIGDRVIDTITTRVADTLDINMRKAP